MLVFIVFVRSEAVRVEPRAFSLLLLIKLNLLKTKNWMINMARKKIVSLVSYAPCDLTFTSQPTPATWQAGTHHNPPLRLGRLVHITSHPCDLAGWFTSQPTPATWQAGSHHSPLLATWQAGSHHSSPLATWQTGSHHSSLLATWQAGSHHS